jgi:hypothetical protein
MHRTTALIQAFYSAEKNPKFTMTLRTTTLVCLTAVIGMITIYTILIYIFEAKNIPTFIYSILTCKIFASDLIIFGKIY